MLAYILMPNLTYSEQIDYIKNVCKNKEFLKHFCASHFCYTGQSMDKVYQRHFCAVGHVTEKWEKMVGRIRVNTLFDPYFYVVCLKTAHQMCKNERISMFKCP